MVASAQTLWLDLPGGRHQAVLEKAATPAKGLAYIAHPHPLFGGTMDNKVVQTLSRAYVQSGWNYPGDAFLQDDDGYFHYQARDDDMIITAGYNVGGPEVEDALLKHPAVAECGVVGKTDDERGMIIKAYCVLRPPHVGDSDLVKLLQDHVKASLAPYKYPREISFVTQLPRTETGKLQRFKLRQMANT